MSAPRGVLCCIQHLVLASMSETAAQREGGRCLLLHYCVMNERGVAGGRVQLLIKKSRIIVQELGF
jgi:hypothetical protein